MKTKVLIIIGMLYLVFFFNQISHIYASEVIKGNQDQALLSFQQKVKEFTEFFKSNPKYVEKEKYPGSPTGVVYVIYEYKLIDISYDVQKTDSLVSPFAGYIDINATIRDNGACRNSFPPAWDNIEEALNNDKESCFRQRPLWGPFRFIFAYQDGKWIFKDVVIKNDNILFKRIWAVFGKPSGAWLEVTEPKGISYNQKWKDLIK